MTVTGKRRERDVFIAVHPASPARVTLTACSPERTTRGRCQHEVEAASSPALALRDATGILGPLSRPTGSIIRRLGLAIGRQFTGEDDELLAPTLTETSSARKK